MEFFSSAAANLCSDSVRSIFRKAKLHIRHVKIYQKHVDKFEENLRMLKAKRESVRQEVAAAERNDEKILAHVEDWCNRVDGKIEEEEKRVKDLKDKEKKKCFIGLCPNIKCRYQLSRKTEKGADAFHKLLQQGEFNRVSYHDVPEDNVDGPPKDFEAFKSREKVFKDIMEALKDATIATIGVHGMAGVGKTILVNEVARQVKKDKLFDAVVMAVVNDKPDIRKIQDQIADSLGLKFEEQSIQGRARRLSERLKKEKKVLVVLDDLWARLDLEEVRIPLIYPEKRKEVEIPFEDESKGCKILLTSRYQDVLNEMGATIFPIGVLEEEDAWFLFKKMAEDSFESLELRSIAIEVAKECAGLPLAIATVARALKKKGIHVWKDALLQLQRPSSTSFMGIAREVYLPIELSYNHLRSLEHKRTFLLCSLLGHHISIQDLLKYTMGLGLFHGVNSVEETRNRLLSVVRDLKASCLLHDSYSYDRVDMHDLISDVALAIACRDINAFSLKPGGILNDWPDEKCTMISLQYANICYFPQELMKGPQLSFLHVNSKDSCMEMPASFFKEMSHLKVLHLTNMNFSSLLPSSISLLTDLRTLCLDRCVLGDISLIGELKSVEILSLSWSDIVMLPENIRELIKLRLFDLTGCSKLKIIPPGLLSSLSRLEELYLGDSFVQWEVERHGIQQTNATLVELKLLSCLTTLEIHIPDAKILPRGLSFEKLGRYKIFIGTAVWKWDDEYESKTIMKLSLNVASIIDRLDCGIKKLLKKTEELYLDDMKGAKIALDGLIDEEDFQHLKNLHIQNCLDIQYIIDDNGAADKSKFHELQSLTLESLPQLISFSHEDKRISTSGSHHQHGLPLFDEKMVFPRLEKLRLSSINVERIWHHRLSSTSLCTHGNLTSLIVEGCGNLKHLLSSSMARSLVKLEYFEISGCKWLKEIIFCEEGDKRREEAVSFPLLKSLKIKKLQHLMGFCSQVYENIQFPSLKLLEIEQCPKLKGFMYKPRVEENQGFSSQALFDDKVAFPSLEKMRISHLSNMKTIWHKVSVNSFCKLTEVEVKHCDELLTLFPCHIWDTFKSLQIVTISSCASLEEIFQLQGLNMQEEHVHVAAQPAVATQISELYIACLPKLKHVWNKDPRGILTFQSLRVIQVWSCGSLKNVFPTSVARDLPQLKDLLISECGVEEIVSSEDGSLEELATQTPTSIRFKFDQLSSLMLWRLPKLKCLYPGNYTTELPMLKELRAYHCDKVKIFGTEDDFLLIQPQPFLFLVEKVLPKLVEVCLNSNDIALICENEKFSGRHYPQIKVLRVLCYHNEDPDTIFPTTFLERFNNLEKLQLHCCRFEELFSYKGGFGDDAETNFAMPTLSSSIKTLRLSLLHNLEHVWIQESHLDRLLPNLETLEVENCNNLINLGWSSAPFQNLMTLDVWECEEMVNLVSSSSAVQGLVQLKNLKIRECASMQEVVGNDESADEEVADDIIFSRLKCLEFQHLPRLKAFCSGNHTFGFPCLEQVIVIQCPELETFCKGGLNAPLLQRVQATEKDEKGHWGGDLNTTVKQLYTKKEDLQGKKQIVLSDFSKLIDIWKENIKKGTDFTNLQVLEVTDCSSLTYIFTIPMALSLVQLYEIKVNNCPMMEHIITDQGAEEATKYTIMLPMLEYITLELCPNLTSFFLGSNTMGCPSLRKITIDKCAKMLEFTSFPREQDMETIGGVNASSFFNDKSLQVLCPNLKYLILVSLNIQKIWPDSQQQKVMSSNVQNLEVINVKGCHRLKYLFSSSSVENFVQLNELCISDCKNIEEVICTEGLEEKEEMAQMLFPNLQVLQLTNLLKLIRFRFGNSVVEPQNAPSLFCEKVAFPSLKYLRILSMGKWRRIWDEDKLIFDSFWELKLLWVEDCERLLNVFPFNMLERLKKLDELQITNCDSLEEIIGPDRLNPGASHSYSMRGAQTDQLVEAESTTKFVFPKVTFLVLEKLPKLKGFFSNVHTTEWPSLQELQVIGCNKLVETFAINGERRGEKQTEISVQLPLFWVDEDTFPNLERLVLDENGIMEWHWQLPAKYFPKLIWLTLIGFPKNAFTLPNCFIQLLPTLEKLEVCKSFFNEIFPSGGVEIGGDEEHADIGALVRLNELRLIYLPELSHIWKEEIPLGQCFSNLRILSVRGCGKLGNVLVPSLVSFKNLTSLKVSKCHGLKNLVTLQTAKNMMLLETMRVTDCQMMTEIVASTGDVVVDGIAFSKLRSLELDSLPSLSKFCSGNHNNFGFPSLKEVIISQCSKMEIFCEGELSTPMLQGVKSAKGKYVGCWEGDLNAIIQQLFVEKVFPSMEDLEKSSIMIQKIWHWILLVASSYAQNLTCLTVEGCPNLKCLFSSSMVTSFVQLKMLKIENCENVETVISMEGLGEGEMMNQTSFRKLDSLLLKDLPKLTRFCHGTFIEFPSLRFLKVLNCPILKTFVSDSVMENQTDQINQDAEGNNLEIAPPTLLSEKVASPCLEEVSIDQRCWKVDKYMA